MKSLSSLLGNLSFSQEPALWISLVNAVLLVLVNFGIQITGDQKIAIDTLLGAILAVLAGVTIRSQVTPVANLNKTDNTDNKPS